MMLTIILFHLIFTINGNNAVQFDQCSQKDSYFAKSTESWEVEVESWSDSFQVNTEIQCPKACHDNTKCQSAAFYLDTNKCLLKDTSRMTVNATLRRIPDRVSFYERKQCPVKWHYIAFVPKVNDCKGIQEAGWGRSGVYTIEGANGEISSILCDMTLLGGGWTTIQQRVDGSVSFARNWTAYKEGFGSTAGNFWYGNERIHNLTWASENNNEIILEMGLTNGNTYYLSYNEFKIGDEEDFYQLHIGQYQALGIGASLTGSPDYRGLLELNGKKFSTMDNDQDGSSGNCADDFQSGFWLHSCGPMNPNGKFGEEYVRSYQGLVWDQFYDEYHPIKYTAYMISSRWLVRRK
ncbi:fibrinogen-like protein 1 [Clytia hemisphaerica]